MTLVFFLAGLDVDADVTSFFFLVDLELVAPESVVKNQYGMCFRKLNNN